MRTNERFSSQLLFLLVEVIKMITARIKIAGLNSAESLGHPLRALQEAWELRVHYLLNLPDWLPDEAPRAKDIPQRWKAMGQNGNGFSFIINRPKRLAKKELPTSPMVRDESKKARRYLRRK